MRALNQLEQLNEFVIAEVSVPEQTILKRIVRQWKKLVTQAGGQLVKARIQEPVTNPYISGNPVEGDFFVGREDILRYLEELWMNQGQRSSVVLYGHRRMGKSSILRRLGQCLGSGTIVVPFTMEFGVSNTNDLLYSLADRIHCALPSDQQGKLTSPFSQTFTEAQNPYYTFENFLDHLNTCRKDKTILLQIDEYELIENSINQGRIEPKLIQFLRAIIQKHFWFVLIMAGRYTLEEKCRDCWNPLFGSVKRRKVSFLSPHAARQLIVQPSPDFALDYDKDAITEIIDLSNGQPYLIQLICQNLISLYNEQRFEEDIEREDRLTCDDIQAVIVDPNFYQDGDAYFSGIWAQAKESNPPGQTEILKSLCENTSQGLTAAELVARTQLSPININAALKTLENHDVILQDGNQRYTYTVELMRRWVNEKKV